MDFPNLSQYLSFNEDGHIISYCFFERRFITFCCKVIRELSRNQHPTVLHLGAGAGLECALMANEGLRVYAIDNGSEGFKPLFGHEIGYYITTDIPDFGSVVTSLEIKPQNNDEFDEIAREFLRLLSPDRVVLESDRPITYSSSDQQQIKEALSAEALRLLKNIGLNEFDAVFCSYMPPGINWMPLIEIINPATIINIVAPSQFTGTGQGSYIGRDYVVLQNVLLKSLLGVNNFVNELENEHRATISPTDTFPAFGLVQVLATTALNKGFRERIAAESYPIAEMYPWEQDLIQLNDRKKLGGGCV